jgi:chloride channel protein, CIC family
LSELQKLKNFFTESFDHKTQILLRVALIGVIIGVVAVAFRKGIEFFANLIANFCCTTNAEWYHWFYFPLVTTAGGLLAGYITQKYAPDAKGSGIPQVKQALNTSSVVIKLRTAFVKFFAGMIAIASGFSLGREGPTVHIGAALASKISRVLGGKHRKRAVASGAGAGLAAAFNTPIAGVIFVIEELDRNMSSLALGPAIVGSVSAAVTCRLLYGDAFTFQFESAHVTGLLGLPLFVFLGVVCAIFGVYFQRSILWSLSAYEEVLTNKLPKWAWGGVAGFVTGVAALYLPLAIGGGHETLEAVLDDSLPVIVLFIIFGAKYFLTVFAYGSGVPGGIFAPAIILGALLGSIVGHATEAVFPDLGIIPANFAFVGMGAFFTAISRAPITSIVMLFELTGNYELVLPLMFACIIANISAERLKTGSIYKCLLEREGIDIKEYSSPSYLQRFSVEDAMTDKVDTINENQPLIELIEAFDKTDHSGFPVLDDDGKLVGIVTSQDMHRISTNMKYDEFLVKNIMTRQPKIMRPSDNLHTAIIKLYEYKVGRLLVVDDSDCDKLVGIITRSDIINFEANQELVY